ncbi:hypothetical protein LCGC14_1088840 [marine sediment metagenome]|uniref:Uncharacterized protein n=1 Tax=marine sediment metagenome TaxID=412755 RepID=A0A0F9QJ34_9ZZZZ
MGYWVNIKEVTVTIAFCDRRNGMSLYNKAGEIKIGRQSRGAEERTPSAGRKSNDGRNPGDR